jgi:DNA-binding response OmpR family regulator
MACIALLEDEADLREEFASYLEAQSHQVLQAGSVAEFSAITGQYGIAVLDVMLGDGCGLEVAQGLRQRDANVGIVMLTARSDIRDKLRGLNHGADHYLVKPVKLAELNAVITALSRRLSSGWRVSTVMHTLIDPQGLSAALSDRELAIFTLVAKAPRRMVERRRIVEALGEDWISYDLRRLDTLVSRLRKRWRDTTGQELPLRTEHGEGYSFSAPLTLC